MRADEAIVGKVIRLEDESEQKGRDIIVVYFDSGKNLVDTSRLILTAGKLGVELRISDDKAPKQKRGWAGGRRNKSSAYFSTNERDWIFDIGRALAGIVQTSLQNLS